MENNIIKLTIKAKIMESLGQASMCWSNIDGAGVFDSSRAIKIGEDLYNFIINEIREINSFIKVKE